MSLLIKTIVLALVATLGVKGHTYHTATCPRVTPAVNFDMSRFLGLWYAIEKTKTSSSCLTYNFTIDATPDKHLVHQNSQNVYLKRLPVKHSVTYTGKISPLDTNNAAYMEVRFPLNIVGAASFVILSTDYTNYAVIFTCQNLVAFHRASATILSRTRTLNGETVRQLRSVLNKNGYSTDSLDVIDHTNCPEHNDGINIHVDENTIQGIGLGTRFGDDEQELDPETLDAVLKLPDDDWLRL